MNFSSCRPHFGASRKIQDGQRIHSSVLVGKTKAPYVPKARPPVDDTSFWKDLPRGWLERDLYEYTRHLLWAYSKRSLREKWAYETLLQIALSGTLPSLGVTECAMLSN